MQNIYVEPERLRNASLKIQDFNTNYKQLKNRLYEEVDYLTSKWQGKDNLAFSNQIKSYQNSLNLISLIIEQYCDFLNNSANAYNQTQEDLYSQAMKIHV